MIPVVTVSILRFEFFPLLLTSWPLMCQTWASNVKDKSKSTKLSVTFKAAGKAKSANVSPLISEAKDLGSQMIGSSQKRKMMTKESSLISALDFDQLPSALQKQFMK